MNFKEFLGESRTPTDEQVVQGWYDDKVMGALVDKVEAAKNLSKLFDEIKKINWEKETGLDNEGYGTLVVYDKININKDATVAKVTATYYVNTSDYNISVDSDSATVTVKI